MSTSSRARIVPVAEITIGARYRRDMGDLQALADSIAAEGLLQPLAVTASLQLVAGERRLRAARDILGWTEIAVHEVDVTSIVAGEYAENIVRKDFTASERVQLADAIKAAIGDRQGARTDKAGAANPPQVPRGTKTREVAASLAGFSSERIMRDARAVLEKGSPDLIAAMDASTIPVSVAHELLALCPEKQSSVVAGGRLRIQEVARELRKERAEKRNVQASRIRLKDVTEGTWPCTYPGCPRGTADPFNNPGSLANHRYAAHQIHSTNFESAQRQARRDRRRQEQLVAENARRGLPPPQIHALDRGQREMLRKRILNVIGQYAQETKIGPAEIIRALQEMLTDDITRPIGSAKVAAVDADRAFATGRT